MISPFAQSFSHTSAGHAFFSIPSPMFSLCVISHSMDSIHAHCAPQTSSGNPIEHRSHSRHCATHAPFISEAGFLEIVKFFAITQSRRPVDLFHLRRYADAHTYPNAQIRFLGLFLKEPLPHKERPLFCFLPFVIKKICDHLCGSPLIHYQNMAGYFFVSRNHIEIRMLAHTF